MRELHAAWHEHGGRHRRGHDAIAPADTRVARPHDGPKHEARDSPKLKMLLDREARIAEQLKYRKTVAAYEGKHAKPGHGAQRRSTEQLKPQEAKPEHAPPETRDKPAGKIAERWDPAGIQREKQPKPQRSRMPKSDTVQMLAGNGLVVASVAVAFHILPDSWDKVAASVAAALVSNVIWGNRRWKDKHGNRPED